MNTEDNKEKNITKILGNAIYTRRKSIRMTQEKLAELVDIGQQSLSRMEQGKIAPKFERLPLFAKALNCQVIDFFLSNNEIAEPCAIRLAELMRNLSEEDKTFILKHIEELIRFLTCKNKN